MHGISLARIPIEPSTRRNTVFDERTGLRIASPELASGDLPRIRPGNLHLVDEETHAEVLADWRSAVQEDPRA